MLSGYFSGSALLGKIFEYILSGLCIKSAKDIKKFLENEDKTGNTNLKWN